jgi:MFS family permease
MREDAAGEARTAGTFAALRVRDFRVLWAGTWASYVPFFMSGIVQGVVAFEISGQNRAVGTVTFAQGVAMLFLAPIGGAGADRWPKRRVLALAQCVFAATFGGLALLYALGLLTIGLLAAGSLAIGAAVSFLGPARQAFAAELVPPELRGNAVSLNQVPLSASQVIGPALAGALLASPLHATGAYALMASLYVASALTLFFLPRSKPPAESAESHVLADLRDGLRYVRSHSRLRLLVVFFVGVVMTGLPYGTLLPGLVEHQLGRPAEAVSALFFASALAGLCATFAAARIADSRLAMPVFLATPLVFALGLVCLSAAPVFALAVAAMPVIGIGFGGLQSLNAAVIVRSAEPAYFGRVFSLTMLAFAGVSLMGLPVGAFADWVGERRAVAFLACLVIAIALTVTVRLRRQPAAQASKSESMRITIRSGSGREERQR